MRAKAHMGLEEQRKRKLSDKELLMWFFKLIKPYIPYLILILILSLIRLLTSLLYPYLTKYIIDSIVNGNVDSLMFFLTLFMGVISVMCVAGFSRIYAIAYVANKLLYDLRYRMFVHLYRLKLDYFSKEETGSIVSRIINDVNTIGSSIASGIIDLVIDLISLGGAIFLMYSLSPDLTIVLLSLIPFILISTYVFARRARKAYSKTRRKIAEITGKITQDIEGAKVIQAFPQRKQFNLEEFKRIARETFEAYIEAAKSAFFIAPTLGIISAIAYSIIIWYGGLLVYWGRTTIGTLIAFLNYISGFFRPLSTLATFYGTIQSALAAGERIYEFLHEEVETFNEGIELENVKGEVVFENVTFGYEKDTPVLKNVNIRVKPGEIIAIVGPTGAGKTTLINLLMRFYEPWSGRILLDGIDIRKIKLESLRRNIGLVLQEPILFSGTVMDNIKIANPKASEEDIIRIVRELGIDDFIKKLPNGYNTKILEEGKNLSMGQRQLIALARALLANPRILVLDEAVSSVDPYTELKIQTAISRIVKGRTCIIIAHRFSTIKIANRIVVIKDGRVVEEGTHRELIERKGVYAKLYSIQVVG